MTIPKDIYVTIVGQIMSQNVIDVYVGEALERVCDSWVMFNTKNHIYAALSLLLKQFDPDDWTGWWIYENGRECWIKDKKHKIKNPEQLWDLITGKYD